MRRGGAARIGLALAGIMALVACKPAQAPHGATPPPPPTLVRTASQTSGVTYTVRAVQDGPNRWRYSIAGVARDGTPARFDAIRFRSRADFDGCTLSLEAPSPASALKLSRPARTGLRADFARTTATPTGPQGWTAASLLLACPLPSGTITLMLTDVSGADRERVEAGPLIGPAG